MVYVQIDKISEKVLGNGGGKIPGLMQLKGQGFSWME